MEKEDRIRIARQRINPNERRFKDGFEGLSSKTPRKLAAEPEYEYPAAMSATEILAELPKLSPDDLQIVQDRIMEMQEEQEIEPSPGLNAAIEEGMKSLKNEPPLSLEEARRNVAKWAGRSS